MDYQVRIRLEGTWENVPIRAVTIANRRWGENGEPYGTRQSVPEGQQRITIYVAKTSGLGDVDIPNDGNVIVLAGGHAIDVEATDEGNGNAVVKLSV